MKNEVLPRPYFLLTVFSRSNWMDPIKRKKFGSLKDASSITEIRKREDEQFAEKLKLTPLFLEYEDCLLREGRAYFRPGKKLQDVLVEKVSRSIAAILKKCGAQNAVVHVPSGRRQHYDHRVVLNAVQHVFPPIRTYFVDDVPYGRIERPRKHRLKIRECVESENLNEKFRVMRIYDSQMCGLFFRRVREIAKRNNGCERLFESASTK